MSRCFMLFPNYWVLTSWLFGCLMLQLYQPVYAQVGAASADQAETQSNHQDKNKGFQTVTGAPSEDVSGLNLMIVAYFLIFILMLAYIARVGLLQNNTKRDLERLERQIKAFQEAEPKS